MKTFDELINIEIDYLGGGYYHPHFFTDDPVKFSAYSTSGETMMDIDRKNGTIFNNSNAGRLFWDHIDMAQASTQWTWNYKGGKLEPILKKLVSEMIFPVYKDWSKQFLSLKSMDIVESDDKLRFNFMYSVFNGIYWFMYFSAAMNIYVDEQNIYDPVILIQKMIEERLTNIKKNGLIIMGGNKIAELIEKQIL